jgi:hypothetical protein
LQRYLDETRFFGNAQKAGKGKSSKKQLSEKKKTQLELIVNNFFYSFLEEIGGDSKT